MLAKKILDSRTFGRQPFGHSLTKVACSIMGIGCPTCRDDKPRACANCKGSGMVPDGGPVIDGPSVVYLEPCRKCIGTGEEECQCCGRSLPLPQGVKPDQWLSGLKGLRFSRSSINSRRMLSLTGDLSPAGDGMRDALDRQSLFGTKKIHARP